MYELWRLVGGVRGHRVFVRPIESARNSAKPCIRPGIVSVSQWMKYMIHLATTILRVFTTVEVFV